MLNRSIQPFHQATGSSYDSKTKKIRLQTMIVISVLLCRRKRGLPYAKIKISESILENKLKKCLFKSVTVTINNRGVNITVSHIQSIRPSIKLVEL